MKVINAKAGELVRCLKEDYVSQDLKVSVTASVGISVYPYNGTNYEELFNKADQSLYDIKQHGKDGFKIYEDN